MKELNTAQWSDVYQSLDAKGYAILPSMLTPSECVEMKDLYPQDHLYRSTINMQRYRFGKGEYRYFSYPLPSSILHLRETLYTPLSVLANQWMQRLNINTTFPMSHHELIKQCQAKGQNRPTPLILRYESGGYNTLHQDLYGDVYFPFQVVVVLSEPGKDFDGGEFILVEQLPRAQSRAEVVQLRQGEGLIFTTNFRPAAGSRGYYRAKMKHGISPLRSGTRYAMGIIFHDAT